MSIFEYLQNIDNTTFFYYFFGVIVVFLVLKNLFILTNQTFFALVIAILIIWIYYYYKSNNLGEDLQSIKKYEKLLKLKYYTFLRKHLDVVLIYYDMISFGRIDKYNLVFC